MADINNDLAAKIDERRRRLDQVDQAIAEMRRLQQEIAPLLRPPTERDPAAPPAVPPAPQRQRHRIGGAAPVTHLHAGNKSRASQAASRPRRG